MVKKKRRGRWRPKSDAQRVGELIFSLLEKMGGSRTRSRLAELWANWTETMGEELASLAVPLGSKDRVLVLVAENAIQMQELHFLAEEIRLRANVFLSEEYFTNVRIELGDSGKNCLPTEKLATPVEEEMPQKLKLPTVTGKYLDTMDMDSPVARCYARFAGKKI